MVSVNDKIKVVSRSPGYIKHLRDRFPKMNLSDSLIRGNSLSKHGFSRFHLHPIRYYSELKSSDSTETIADLNFELALSKQMKASLEEQIDLIERMKGSFANVFC